MKPEFFKNALSSFTGDVAYAGAVRHLAQKGMTLNEIKDNLTYPAPESKIREVLWQYYLDEKIICLEKPENVPFVKSEFVKVTGAYGKSSFVKKEAKEISDNISKENSKENKTYAVCRFGTYKKDELNKYISALDENDKEYIKGINWPDRQVFHIMNSRMERIAKSLNLETINV